MRRSGARGNRAPSRQQRARSLGSPSAGSLPQGGDGSPWRIGADVSTFRALVGVVPRTGGRGLARRSGRAPVTIRCPQRTTLAHRGGGQSARTREETPRQKCHRTRRFCSRDRRELLRNPAKSKQIRPLQKADFLSRACLIRGRRFIRARGHRSGPVVERKGTLDVQQREVVPTRCISCGHERDRVRPTARRSRCRPTPSTTSASE